MEHIFETYEKCLACEGTGLYVGYAEKEGASVVCRGCEGTGQRLFSHKYWDFEGRQVREGVTHVYEVNPGIYTAPGVVPGGIPYKDWLENGKFPPGTEMREHVCPAWWYQCVSDTEDLKPRWDQCIGAGSFGRCEHFPDKLFCWAHWDKEFGKAE